jgi:tRNA (guanine37-N1)-methyltransferase
MKITILTLFPELFTSYFENGLVKKAIDKGILTVDFVNYRDFTEDLHKTVDDIPFGGGSGMVVKPEPVIKAFLSIPSEVRDESIRIIPSARGQQFDHKWVKKIAERESVIFFAGRYKGFDQRIVELTDGVELSIGDYVVQGGELPITVMIDAVVRFIPGFLGDEDSAATDSFAIESRLLSAPDYTRPREFMGLEVPKVLTSGNHALIDKWKKTESFRITMKRRPDLIPMASLSEDDFEILEELKKDKQSLLETDEE